MNFKKGRQNRQGSSGNSIHMNAEVIPDWFHDHKVEQKKKMEAEKNVHRVSKDYVAQVERRLQAIRNQEQKVGV